MELVNRVPERACMHAETPFFPYLQLTPDQPFFLHAMQVGCEKKLNCTQLMCGQTLKESPVSSIWAWRSRLCQLYGLKIVFNSIYRSKKSPVLIKWSKKLASVNFRHSSLQIFDLRIVSTSISILFLSNISPLSWVNVVDILKLRSQQIFVLQSYSFHIRLKLKKSVIENETVFYLRSNKFPFLHIWMSEILAISCVSNE